MKAMHLIACVALMFPVAMAHAQPAPSQETSTRNSDVGSEAESVKRSATTDADLTKGKVVNDPSGQPVGTIDSLNEEGIVLSVGERRVQVPRTAIGKNEIGLVIQLTRAEIEAAVNVPTV